jgi:hypothetical protein
MQVKEKEGAQQKGVGPSRARVVVTRAPRRSKEYTVTEERGG